MLIPCFYSSSYQQPLTWKQTLHNVASSCLYTPHYHTHYDEIDSVSLEKTRQITVISNPWDAILTVAKVLLAVATILIVPIACYLYTYSTNTQNCVQLDSQNTQIDRVEAQDDTHVKLASLISSTNTINDDLSGKILILISEGDLEGIQKLLKDGFPANQIFYHPARRTILHHAAASGQRDIVKEMVKHLNRKEINTRDKFGKTALNLVCETGGGGGGMT
jgi:hypothetical protein